MKINSYSTYQITNISKKETNNEIKKVDNKADDKKVGVVLGYGVDKDGFLQVILTKPQEFLIIIKSTAIV